MQIVKRDGSKQEFSAAKIAKVVHAAGLSEEKAQELSEQVEAWFKVQASEGKKELSSLEIKDKVSSLLEKTDKYAWGLYNWYEKTKLKN